jgi:acylphosphatase
VKKRVVLRAVGEVQKVGYRDFVQKIARKLGIVGNVENMRDS